MTTSRQPHGGRAACLGEVLDEPAEGPKVTKAMQRMALHPRKDFCPYHSEHRTASIWGWPQ